MNHSMQINARIYFEVCAFWYTCICSHNYSIMYQKSNVREGNIRTGGAQGGENSLTGLFGAWNGAGAWTGPGAGVEKGNALPQAINRYGAGN